MQRVNDIGIDEFLREYPLMVIRPSRGPGLRLSGEFTFTAEHRCHGSVTDRFALEIDVPTNFPRELPIVRETAGRIPRGGEFHVNGDGSLCLGSDLRLLIKTIEVPTLTGFAARCIVPYLYAVSLKLKKGGGLVFGELAHFGPGMLQDYAQLLSLPTVNRAYDALRLLCMKKRIANRFPCPCGCERRLGLCRFRYRLLRFRSLNSRAWFQRQLAMVNTAPTEGHRRVEPDASRVGIFAKKRDYAPHFSPFSVSQYARI